MDTKMYYFKIPTHKFDNRSMLSNIKNNRVKWILKSYYESERKTCYVVRNKTDRDKNEAMTFSVA